jgi:hypothetical protein
MELSATNCLFRNKCNHGHQGYQGLGRWRPNGYMFIFVYLLLPFGDAQLFDGGGT